MFKRIPNNPLDPRSTVDASPKVARPPARSAEATVDAANAPREGCWHGENIGDPVAHGDAPKGVATLGVGRDPAKETPRSTT